MQLPNKKYYSVTYHQPSEQIHQETYCSEDGTLCNVTTYVYNKKGEKVGENTILKMQDNCVIQENWMSKGQTGTSYNFYNKSDQSWNQVYIDNFGTVLELKGNLINNEMVLESKKIKSTNADFHYFNRITWSKQENGDVRQRWDIVSEDNKIIQVVFDGIYKRK